MESIFEFFIYREKKEFETRDTLLIRLNRIKLKKDEGKIIATKLKPNGNEKAVHVPRQLFIHFKMILIFSRQPNCVFCFNNRRLSKSIFYIAL